MMDDIARKLAEVGARLDQEERERMRAQNVRRSQERADAKVCGGIYRPEPVDLAAAMLLAKASWISLPPSSKPVEPEKKKRRRDSMDQKRTKDQKRILKNATPRLVEVMEEVNGCEPGDAVKAYEDATEMFTAAASALGQASFGFKQEAGQLEEVAAKALEMVRSKRYALLSETSKAMEALREVRQFFIGPDYERERDRLGEFVSLCERLMALKKSGFLDVVGDTMLKLAMGPQERTEP